MRSTFHLPVRTGVKVERLSKEGDGFVVNAGGQQFESDNVVVAMANYQILRLPAFAQELDPSIVQMHSHDYRNPSQLREGGVLIVGVGNSGADIGIEAGSYTTRRGCPEKSRVTFRSASKAHCGGFSWCACCDSSAIMCLTVDTPIGRKLRPKLLSRAAPLVRVKPQDLIDAGIERVPRVVGVQNGRPLLQDDRSTRM